MDGSYSQLFRRVHLQRYVYRFQSRFALNCLIGVNESVQRRVSPLCTSYGAVVEVSKPNSVLKVKPRTLAQIDESIREFAKGDKKYVFTNCIGVNFILTLATVNNPFLFCNNSGKRSQ